MAKARKKENVSVPRFLERIHHCYIHPDKGVIFVTFSNREYAYKFYRDASGAIYNFTLEEVVDG